MVNDWWLRGDDFVTGYGCVLQERARNLCTFCNQENKTIGKKVNHFLTLAVTKFDKTEAKLWTVLVHIESKCRQKVFLFSGKLLFVER